LKKVCNKVSLCENCQRQSCKAFIGQSIRAKMIDGGRSLRRILTHFLAQRRFSIYFRSAEPPSKKVQLTRIRSPLRTFQ